MIVQEPTHLDNGLLDDSYVKKITYFNRFDIFLEECLLFRS